MVRSARMASGAQGPRIVTLTLNPAVELVLESPGFARERRPDAAARTIARLPGGKGGNVSRVLAELGVASVACGPVGREAAEFFREGLAGHAGGLARSGHTPVAARARTAVTIIDPESGQDSHVREAGEAPTPGELAVLRGDVLAQCAPGVTLALCGSAPPGMDAGFAVDLMRAAAGCGARVAADVSGVFLRAALMEPLWLVKVNAEELGEVVGARITKEEDAARAILGVLAAPSGPRAIIVTLGADGAVLARRDGPGLRARCGLAAERVVSAVGAGDAFLAGLLAGLGESDDWSRGMRWAVAAGAACAARPEPGAVGRELHRDLVRIADVGPL